jgi:hypothetical protein
MAHDKKVNKVFEVFIAPEDTVEVLREALPTGLDDTVDLNLNLKHSFSEV